VSGDLAERSIEEHRGDLKLMCEIVPVSQFMNRFQRHTQLFLRSVGVGERADGILCLLATTKVGCTRVVRALVLRLLLRDYQLCGTERRVGEYTYAHQRERLTDKDRDLRVLVDDIAAYRLVLLHDVNCFY
jgi:hypothetical protein